ncbi:MAG: M1 family metallopeptidase [Pseudomonadota bacterium]
MIQSVWRASLFAAASLTVLAACDSVRTPLDEKETVSPAVLLETPPAGQLPEGVAPTAYRLTLDTDPTKDGFSGIVEIDVSLDEPHARIWLHALDQNILSAKAVTVDGDEISATFEGGLADGGVSKLDFETPVPAGAATLVIDYEAPYNFGLAGLYKASQSGKDYLATQMEAIDARRMTPSFDEPRFKTPWTLTVTTPAGNKVITNGPKKSETVLDDGRVRHVFAETRQIQSNLIAMAVGPYDQVSGDALPPTSVRERSVPFRGFAPAGKGEKLEAAMDATREMLEWQEAYFDYPYPYAKLDLIAVPDFAYGAMENAGAIIYREAALLIDERTSLARRRGVLTVHAHELAHQWFGNLVTPTWWDDIWLNEAFATWLSYKTMHAYDPEGGFDRSPIRAALGAMGADSLLAARQIRNPIESNADINDAFDAITYRKGGGVLNMFETYLGEEAFRDGMRLHMTRFEDGVADVNDFMASLAEGSGQPDIVPAFESFIFQPGIPFLEVSVLCAGESTGGEVSETIEATTLRIAQSRYAPLGSDIDTGQKWTAPFSARTSDGVEVRQLLSDALTEIPLESCPEWVMPNTGGAGYWRFNTNAENWTALTDNFTSLTAGEQLVFVDSLAAGFETGQVDAERLLEGLKAATQGEWDAVSASIAQADGLLDLLTEDQKPVMRAWLRETFGPLHADFQARADDTLGSGETLLKQRLYQLMVGAAQEPELRADLLERAKAYVGVGGEPDQTAIAPAELGSAMAIGAKEGGDAFFDAAAAFGLASSNQSERGAIFGALVRQGPEAKVVELLNGAFENGMVGQEIVFAYLGGLANEPAQSAVWEVFKSNFDKVVEVSPELRKPQLARAVGTFCDVETLPEAIAFIEGKAQQIPGYERTLAQSSEGAKLCVALKEAKGEELANAVSSAASE